MKLKKVNCFNGSRFRVLVEDFFALTVTPPSTVPDVEAALVSGGNGEPPDGFDNDEGDSADDAGADDGSGGDDSAVVPDPSVEVLVPSLLFSQVVLKIRKCLLLQMSMRCLSVVS